MTTVINLFGGPGCGKSTMAAGIFHRYKEQNISIELVTEFAKDLTWSQRWKCLDCQPYIFGEQVYRIERLIDKVDYIVTDSPFLLSAIYMKSKYPESFRTAIVDIYNSFDNRNFLLERLKPYHENGRTQNKSAAVAIDEKIEKFLVDNSIPFTRLSGLNEILGDIL